MTRRGRGRPPYPDVLTPAEWRILDEVRTGATNAEIAIRLGLSPYTVKYHISNILGKLELRNRREIAGWRPEPEPVRLGQMVPARVRAFLAPLALLPKPLIGIAAATGIALVAIPTIVLAVLLTRPSEPVNLLISPAPIALPGRHPLPPPRLPPPRPHARSDPSRDPDARPYPRALPGTHSRADRLPPTPTPEPTPEPTPTSRRPNPPPSPSRSRTPPPTPSASAKSPPTKPSSASNTPPASRSPRPPASSSSTSGPVPSKAF